MDDWVVLLYYYYIPIENTIKYKQDHISFLKKYDFRGRIIISSEGLNGTLSGKQMECEEYIKFVKKDIEFKNIEFKIDKCDGHLFPKLSVKIRNNLININRDDLNPNIETGIHITPKKFLEKMNESNSIVVDMRSNYEHHIGKFKNAITFDIKHFLTLEENIKNSKFYIDDNKDKDILTYCTGGIRCEKASALLLKMGFKNVYQLDGGIIKYGNEVGGENFEGKCYVFDNRITKVVNKINPKVISKCYICKITEDTMVNCINTKCNRHTTICKKCYIKMEGCCSYECINSKFKRSILKSYHK